MTGSANGSPAPILVLGLGNLLLGDDGVGLRLLDTLAAESGYGDAVDFVDGGTQGLALLGYLADREAVLVLDAITRGDPPGRVHVLRGVEDFRARRAGSAHESSALELFETARILGNSWRDVVLVGIEPKNLRTGMELSAEVEASISAACGHARAALREMVESYVPSNSR